MTWIARSAPLWAAVGLGLMGGAARAGESEAPHLGACGPVVGGFQLPGTDACLRLSGYVATNVGARSTPDIAATGFAPVAARAGGLGTSAIGTDARLSADVMVPTDLGPARVFVSLRARHGGLPTAR